MRDNIITAGLCLLIFAAGFVVGFALGLNKVMDAICTEPVAQFYEAICK